MNLTEAEFARLPKRVRSSVKGLAAGGVSAAQKMGKPAFSPSKYRSKWEEQFAYELVLEQRANLIKGWAYEDMTFKLAEKKSHRPDFLIWHLDGSIEIAQVKGHHKNLRASLTALAWAAQQRPWFRFTIKRREGQGWRSEEVTG